MQTLFFRNRFVFGVLMVCVLALGVQGIAKAQEISSPSGDLQTVKINQDFSISFKVKLSSDREDEGISIAVANTGNLSSVTIEEVEDNDPDSDAQHDMDEVDDDDDDFSGNNKLTSTTINVDLNAGGSKGPATITVTPDVGGSAETFNVYVVDDSDIGATAPTVTDAAYRIGVNEVLINDGGDDVFTIAANLPLRYSISGGSLYVKDTTSGRTRSIDKSGKHTTSSSAPVYLDVGGKTVIVSVYVEGHSSTRPARATIIYRYPQLSKVSGDSPKQLGAPNSRLLKPFTVHLTDASGKNVPGQIVTFTSGNGTFAAHPDFPDDTTDSNIPAGTPQTVTGTDGASPAMVTTDSKGNASVYLIFGDAGEHTITAQIGSVTNTQVTFEATAVSATEAEASSLRKVADTDGQDANAFNQLDKPLTVVVYDQGGNPIVDVPVMFQDRSGGALSYRTGDPGTPDPDSTGSRTRTINTDVNGQASIRYRALKGGGKQTVSASIIEDDYQSVIFTINGAPSRDTGDDDDDDDNQPITRTISISPSTITGAPETTQTLTVSAGTATVRVADASAFTAAGGTISGSGTTRSITLPDTPGSNYSITFSASGYTEVTVPVIVTAPLANGTLTPTLGTRTGNQQPITVRAVRGGSAQSGVNLTITGGTTSVSRQTDSSGSASAIITLQTATSAHTLTVRATGYNTAEITVSAPSRQPPADPTPPTTGVADSVRAIGEVFQSGTLNTQLDLPLSVRVLDANGRGVENAKVTFRVRDGQGRLSQRGNGRGIIKETDSSGHARATYTPMSASSTVRATAAGVTQTVTFTITTGAAPPATGTPGATRTYKTGDKIPLSTGSTLNFSGSRTVNGTTYTCVGPGECVVSHGLVAKGEIRSATTPTVQAKAYKVGEKIPISLNDTLTFTSSHTVEGTTYTCVGPGECVVSHGLVAKGEIRVATKTGDTPRTTAINPVVHVAAAQRPPMLWVDNGDIYALVGANVQSFIPSVTNAIGIAIGGNKVYWTELSTPSSGTINSANLNGTGIKQLASIQAVPMAIAVDAARSKLYWTNSRGRIQSANLDGSGIRNVMQNLSNPQDIALAGGNAYWTETTGAVKFVNLNGQKQVRTLSTGTNRVGSLAIGGGKVYWTEQSGEWTAVSESETVFDPDSRGTVHSANLNGDPDAKQLASIQAAPIGIAVDAARSKLYWTNSRGRIQSANLDGSKIQNVVDGLGSPGDMVISNSLKAPAGTTTAPKTTTAANKYDVNGDGTVDSKDSDALTVALAAGVTDAKYDVNGDGKVDIHDLVAVSANRSAGAAGAPALIGNIKLSAIQIDRLQEQIELLIATGDRSPAAMKTLIYLQQLIALARPEQTQLFANYPNPFNPETWMPYELATDTNVKITIYNPQGVVIRTLVLGHQSAGYYTDRERAAYWDGRNALGEQVASGIYFYQFETDDMSLMRKMVILK